MSVVLAALVVGQILADDTRGAVLRITGVFGILDVLGAVVTVGVARFGARPSVRAAGALTLPPELRTALDDRAAATGRTSTDLLAEAVRSYLRG